MTSNIQFRDFFCDFFEKRATTAGLALGAEGSLKSEHLYQKLILCNRTRFNVLLAYHHDNVGTVGKSAAVFFFKHC